MSRQAKCAVTSEVHSDPEKGCNSKADSAWWMPGKALAAVGWLVLGTSVFLASAASRLQAGCRAVSAGGGLLNGSRRLLVELADSVAARRLVVAVCTPGEMSQHKSSSDRSAPLFTVARTPNPRALTLLWSAMTGYVVVGSHKHKSLH
jgi:hypothetical protein